MIEKVVRKYDKKELSSVKEDLAYWLSKTPEDRIGAVEILRRQAHGDSERLQRTAHVIQQNHGILKQKVENSNIFTQIKTL